MSKKQSWTTSMSKTKQNQFSGKSIRRLLLQAVRALRTNKFDDAIIYLDEILEREPDNNRGVAILFTTYYRSKQFDNARAVGSKAAELNPSSEYILNNQACLLIGAGETESAKELLLSLIEQYGNTAQWLYNLGLAHQTSGDYELAIESFKSAMTNEPDHHQSAIQLSALQTKLGLHEQANETLNLLRLITTSQPTTNAGYINHSIRYGLLSKSSVEQEIALWGDQFIPKNRRYAHNPMPAKNQPLKIGFIIGAIPSLTWEIMILPLLEQLNKKGHEICIFWHNADKPKTTLTVYYCRNLSDANFAREIRNKPQDVLIDIGGMHIQTRERALGLQLAKKQFGWLKHPGMYSTDCVNVLDNLLEQRPFAVQIPSKLELPNSQKLPQNTIAAIGCASGLSEQNLKLWAKILSELPKKKMMLDVENVLIQNRLTAGFNEHGISADRLQFAENIICKKGDIVLANLYDNPIDKSCLAYTQGATLITLNGELLPARQTARLLKQTDNEDWIAENDYDYIKTVVECVTNKTKNTKLKSQIKQSGLFDINSYADIMCDNLY